MKLTKVNRGILTDILALLLTLIISYAALAWYHIPTAITPVQIIALVVASALPLQIFGQEKGARTLLRSKVHLHQAKVEIVAFAALAAGITYGNYLLNFVRHGVSPTYIDTGHPLYMQATSLALLTLALCSFLNILFIRVDNKENIFGPELWTNKKLLRAGGISLLFVILVIYSPLQAIFATESLGVIEWLAAIVAAALYTGLRRLQRHTRQHTRHAVVKLHHEVHGKHKMLH